MMMRAICNNNPVMQEECPPFNTIDEIVCELQLGKMVVLLDDEQRENEGDLIMAAQFVSAQAINFMTRYGRGLVCMPMAEQRCCTLGLQLMTKQGQSRFATNFTVSIEAARGVTTGISCADRALTIKTAARMNAKAQDLIQPGHIFPLMAKPGGVLTRPGHTEAVVDLVQMAGLGDAGVLVEILNEDGSMARRPELHTFAIRHGLKIGCIADLITYRLATEQLGDNHEQNNR